ncbi:MAG: ABA4-like family protein [Chitinophagales bacterium]
MNNDQIFSAVSMLALCSWLLLIIAPYRKLTEKIIFSGIIAILSILYVYLIVFHIREAPDGGFNSLNEVALLFKNPALLLAGWIHYLAFDLLVGLFIVNNARQHQINRWILIPCLLLTFMFGPCGLLLYVLIRTYKARQYITTNF